MDGIRQASRLVEAVVASGALGDDPLVLVDIGCGLGIDAPWRCFGKDLRALGFDPNLAEIERLRAAETHPGVEYQAGWVGLPPGDPFLREKGDRDHWGRNPWDRLSVSATGSAAVVSEAELAEQNRWHEARLADRSCRVDLRDQFSSSGVDGPDFVKLDVDGPDFEILMSIGPLLEAGHVLGIGTEVNFFGSSAPTDHTFHNTDRFLKAKGLELFALSTRKYSTAALPARFIQPYPAETVNGRVVQGDALYFRDLANPEHRPVLDRARPTQLLKLACLFDLCDLADCAAEILLLARDRIEPTVPVEGLLDALVPDPWNGELSYREYLNRFDGGDPMFFSPGQAANEESTPSPAVLGGSRWRNWRARYRARRRSS